MAMSSVWKLEDQNSYPANSFPARGLTRKLHEGSGSWVVAYAEEQFEKFKSTYRPNNFSSEISAIDDPSNDAKKFIEKKCNVLDATYLMQKHHVDDPLDLCSVDIADQKLNHIENDQFYKFTNVAYVNAAENFLPFVPFDKFPNLREIELPVNGIKNIKLTSENFPNLQVLDLSYNQINAEDVLALGVLQSLKVLTLTGNSLTSIHPDIARPDINYLSNVEDKVLPRFSKLQVLYLDHNKLSDVSTFASLAALPQLQELYLDNNGIEVVPHLKVVGDRVVSEAHSSLGRHASIPSSSLKSRISQKLENQKPKEIVIDEQDISSAVEKQAAAVSDLPEMPSTKSNFHELESSSMSESAATANPPFENLRLLSLSNNLIKEEECVLAVAAWPRLKHLVLSNNPLIKLTKGEPPLLSHYLKERLGIRIHRFEQHTTLTKPNVIIPVDKSRKISSKVRKLPKQHVDLFAALEGSKAFLTQSNSEFQEDVKEMPSDTEEFQKNFEKENIFLTSIDEQHHEVERKENSFPKKEAYQKQLSNLSSEENLNDLEILQNANEDECSFEDAGIQNNVSILNKMINRSSLLNSIPQTLNSVAPIHPTTSSLSRNLASLHKLQKKENISKQKQLSHHLNRLRSRPVINMELPLSEALHFEKNQFVSNEAEALLEEVEKKYRIVREESIKTSQNIKAALEESKKMIQDFSK